MTLASVQADLARRAPDLHVMVTDASTATVQLAAEVHGCEPGQIAKTAAFGGRPRMLGPEDVLRLTSHEVGGVCPFGLPVPLTIYCDVSLKIYDEVIPAGGSTHASVRLPLARLVELCGGQWADACDVPDAGAKVQS